MQCGELSGDSANAAPSAGTILINSTARADFDRIIAVLSTVESVWHGVRYIRDELLQQAHGGSSPTAMTLPQNTADLLDMTLKLPEQDQGCKSSGRTATETYASAVVGLSLTGITNSPTNRCDLVYPAGMTGGFSQALTNDADLMAWIKEVMGDT